MSVKVTLIDNSNAWLKREEAILQSSLRRMAQNIVNTAKIRTPKLTGQLRSTGHIEGGKNEILVVFGNNTSVKYAAVQERGYWISGPNAGKHIKHYTTPDTGPNYLKNTAEKIIKKGIKPYLP